MLRSLLLLGSAVGLIVVVNMLDGSSSSAAFTASVVNADSFASGALTGTNAPASGTTFTATDNVAGTCTATFSALSGGTTIASAYELDDIVTASVLTNPGNVNAGTYTHTPTQTVSRYRLLTRSGTNWVSTNANSDTAACVMPSTRAVAVGRTTACAIRTAGTLWCWGDNDQAQLGQNDYVVRDAPLQVGAVTTWRQVSTTNNFVCATRSDGTLWCWGYNGTGQLGVGDTTPYGTPRQVGASTTWRQVATGWDSSCATRSDGTLWCWGDNWAGQLGIGSTSANTSPVQVGSATTWRQVSVGGYHACGVRSDGSLYCWGYNAYGAVGDGTTTDATSPLRIGSATDWRSVAVGYFHGCGAQTGGRESAAICVEEQKKRGGKSGRGGQLPEPSEGCKSHAHQHQKA